MKQKLMEHEAFKHKAGMEVIKEAILCTQGTWKRGMREESKQAAQGGAGSEGNLVPRASFPLTSGRKTRALGATIWK